jgi:hypothetical protein
VKGVEELIGAPVEAGCVVNPPGSAGAIARGAMGKQLGAGSTVGASADADVTRKSADALPQPVGSWQAAYLALTAESLVLVGVKQGLVRPKPFGELARIPRSAVTGYELDEGGLQSPFSLALNDGTSWSFGLPKLHVKNAKELLGRLGL